MLLGILLTAESHTLLFDKRRLPCYSGIPIVQYAHVTSTLSIQCGCNILIGQLHRFRQLITVRSNYVWEVARLVKRMQDRGYRLSLLRRKLKQHLQVYPDTFGDVRPTACVFCCYAGVWCTVRVGQHQGK